MHGALLNPAGGNWPNSRGLRNEFVGDKGRDALRSAQWLYNTLKGIRSRGYDLIYIRPLFGWERNFAMPMLNAANTTPEKLSRIMTALRKFCMENPGVTLMFHCSVRSDLDSNLPTINRGDAIPYHYSSKAAIADRIKAWEPLRRAIEPFGSFAACLDDGGKWPAHVAQLAMIFNEQGVQIVSEPPLAEHPAGGKPEWMQLAKSVPSLAGPSWTNTLLRNGVYPEPGQAPVYLWWGPSHHAEYGMDGLKNAINRGYWIINECPPSTHPDVDELLAGRNRLTPTTA